MKARPTMYREIAMRSRNEAAFAQYLDKQKWNWEYEPFCYADETGQYLPDFRILFDDQPGSGIYVELKPTEDMAWGARHAMLPIRSTHPSAVLAVAAPWDGAFGCFGALRLGETEWARMKGYWPDLPTRIPGRCRCGSEWIDPEYGRCEPCWRDLCWECDEPLLGPGPGHCGACWRRQVVGEILQSGKCSGRCLDVERPSVEYCILCPFYEDGS